jgi:hypothetical protein
VTTEALARAHHQGRQRLARAASAAARRAWRKVNLADLDGSWATVEDPLLAAIAAGQLDAAAASEGYLDKVLAEQRIDPAAAARLSPGRFSGIASDGRPLASLLQRSVVATKAAIGAGVAPQRVLAFGYTSLDLIAVTQVADAGRVADQVALVARRKVGGYVRMVGGSCCSRCAILAGRWYRWNQGFKRHPRCRCVNIPSAEDRSGDLRTDPKLHFASLSPAEQDRIYTKAGAAAIRDGADISQVVNARRGMQAAGESRTRVNQAGLVVNERHRTRTGATTRESTTRSGVAQPGRLMPEQLYLQAGGDRDQAIRLLRLNGYLT